MRELSLFSGAGGGLLGTKLLGWTTVGYVEWEDYCQRVIAQRIKDGCLDKAPIFGDIRTFIGEGYAASYTGMVDVVTGGFPCQPFSVAGKRKGEDDERNMWPATLSVIRIIRPKFIFLENVTGLLSSGYLQQIFRDLASCGYDARWRIVSAAEVGAPHLRERLFIVAHDRSVRIQRDFKKTIQRLKGFSWCKDVRRIEDLFGRPEIPQPLFRGNSDGVPFWMDRLVSIGNGQVPQVVRTAWNLLTEDL